MKIAIPVDEASMESNVCVSFGRAPYFLIFDTETQNSNFVDNQVAASSSGGAGIKAAQLVVDQGVEALLTPRCGENASDVFDIAKIKRFKTINSSIQDNLNAFHQNQLQELIEIHKGHHHGGQ